MAETYKHSKRHQEKSRKGRKRTPIYRGSVCGLRSRLNHLKTLNKAQQELKYNRKQAQAHQKHHKRVETTNNASSKTNIG